MINRTVPDPELYLYGLQTRGDVKEISDWDLLILLNSSKIPFDFEIKLLDEFYDVELDTGEIISPLIYSKTEW